MSASCRWLKLKDAAGYSSIGKTRLKELAARKVIRGFKDPDSDRGDWIFDKESLDDYRIRQSGGDAGVREKVLAIMKGVRL
jgi:hypothetical protein